MGLRRRSSAHTRLLAPTPGPTKPARAAVAHAERHAMIARAAYARAERGGFRTDSLADWLAAEREIDADVAS